MNDPFPTIAILGLAIAIIDMALSIGSKIWSAPEKMIARISFMVQLAILLILSYLLILLTHS